ncbi:hypothetical protein HYPDE_25823 [Hyphomicrobium denitrificans 1NES1]|uniref:Uncharacterized protein n=1 Tax=Hyphomicrobium denitrificans 1NES1 TaxID=670307 RepID=N0B3S1_9HYPH|nr:hypothetical protein HYPDE_25823 [Hyphomicrobium denitrificans 1NES1]
MGRLNLLQTAVQSACNFQAVLKRKIAFGTASRRLFILLSVAVLYVEIVGALGFSHQGLLDPTFSISRILDLDCPTKVTQKGFRLLYFREL